ncbi:hypothetical protein Anapl_10674 [Anas platyrhynchos]|uniref:Uncharacterized protein n=1 Tax=Anas platyrhynchos TaxID=8839 RepID=R0JGU1_ANAPL|nr:hypothetical protein Anapl_10674 [Anas platyrhynchos]
MLSECKMTTGCYSDTHESNQGTTLSKACRNLSPRHTGLADVAGPQRTFPSELRNYCIFLSVHSNCYSSLENVCMYSPCLRLDPVTIREPFCFKGFVNSSSHLRALVTALRVTLCIQPGPGKGWPWVPSTRLCVQGSAFTEQNTSTADVSILTQK